MHAKKVIQILFRWLSCNPTTWILIFVVIARKKEQKHYYCYEALWILMSVHTVKISVMDKFNKTKTNIFLKLQPTNVS